LNNNILAEPGIERINGNTRGWGNPGTATGWSRDFIDNTIKKTTIWDPNYYLNIWVVPYIGGLSSTILGYATFPGMTGLNGMPSGAGDPLNDGFVCRTSYFGNTGGGRTATHEIGHWLGLRHIWGDNGQCNADDFCNDTPKQYGGTASPAGCNYGCPTYPHNANLCDNNPNGDMYMNFMDYTNDNCMALFTNDQSARFQATMQFGDFRKNLKFSPGCDTVLQKPVAKFTYLKQNAGLCATTQKFDFTDKSLFKPTSWSWTFQGGTPATSTAQNPTSITFTTSGLHDVTLTVTNARGTHTATYQVNVPIVGTASFPFFEDFESIYFPPLGWETVNRNGNPAINWDVRNGYSGYGIGNRSMIFDNTSLDGKFAKDDIQTPKINLTGVSAAKLKFDVAYAPFFGDLGSGVNEFLWDTLEVLITDNCQATAPQRIYRKGQSDLATNPAGQGDEFYPLSTQWRSDTVVIPAAYLNKPNVQLIFRNYGDYGHTIYIDNINLFGSNTTPTATASFTASDTLVCVGGTLTFTNTSTASAGSPDSVKWTINGGTPSTSTSATTVTSTFNTVGTYTISLVAYKSGNASTAATKSIRVRPNAAISFTSAVGTNAQVKCVNTAITNITYSVTGGGTGAGVTGLPTGVTGSFAGGVFTISGTPSVTGTFNYTVTTTGTCAQATQTGTITVNALPTVAATTGATSVCVGLTTTYSNTTSGGVWSSSATGIATVNASGVVTGVSAGTSTISYTVTSNGCSTVVTKLITVNALPTVAATTGATSVCVGLTTTYSNTTAGGVWSSSATGIATVNASGVVTGVSAGTAEIRYTVTSNGCSTTATKLITVNALPTVSALTGTASVCVGSTTTFSSTTSGGVWSSSATGIATVNASGVVTGVSAGTSTISYAVTTNGCTTTVTRDVTVNAKPNVTVTSPSICSGSTATIQANGAADGYTWTGGLSGNPATTPVLNTTTTYTVTGTTNGCSNTAVSTVTVSSSAPTVTITSNPVGASVCNGDAITLTANGANSYTWTSTQTGTTTGGSLNFIPTSNLTVNLSGTVTGCTTPGTTSVNVTIKSKPSVGVSSPSICTGETAQPVAQGGDSYTWTGGLPSVSNPTTPALTATTTYTVTGTTNGCSNTAVSV